MFFLLKYLEVALTIDELEGIEQMWNPLRIFKCLFHVARTWQIPCQGLHRPSPSAFSSKVWFWALAVSGLAHFLKFCLWLLGRRDASRRAYVFGGCRWDAEPAMLTSSFGFLVGAALPV